jgi:hypothetical protein
MTREERHTLLGQITEAEARCRGWTPDDLNAYERDISAWWLENRKACEDFIVQCAATARRDLEILTRRRPCP